MENNMTNWKTFERECRKRGYNAEAVWEEAQESNMFNFGLDSISHDLGYKKRLGRIETVDFDLVSEGIFECFEEDDENFQNPIMLTSSQIQEDERDLIVFQMVKSPIYRFRQF